MRAQAPDFHVQIFCAHELMDKQCRHSNGPSPPATIHRNNKRWRIPLQALAAAVCGQGVYAHAHLADIGRRAVWSRLHECCFRNSWWRLRGLGLGSCGLKALGIEQGYAADFFTLAHAVELE